jgi:hypothetical protein
MSSYWRVNSYGYPNPFSDDRRHRQAWETLSTFYAHNSYSALKNYWSSTAAPRSLTPHAVESWKAAFEEFGLLYVLGGSDQIRVTPAGWQFRDAADENSQLKWVWVGLNLILRYPLRGPRGSRKGQQANSDLLPYWFLFAALRELNNYFWFPELERVLGTTMTREDAPAAIQLIRQLRAGDANISSVPLPVSGRRGQFYNSLNQVPNHASLGYMLMDKSVVEPFYDEPLGERRHDLLQRWVPQIDLALGGTARENSSLDCGHASSFIDRMPAAPDFEGDEEAYFQYLGSEVTPMDTALRLTGVPREMPFGQGTVVVLRAGIDYVAHGESVMVGPVASTCRLVQDQRVILSHDLARTYKVQAKERVAGGKIAVTVRRARPISDPAQIEAFLREAND